ncbi:pyrophosphatase PpaX [Virgibacillus sp. SK37]|uniref:pyrophosphatase PpaX n=1 Tax=Virgibacillus sp. SK37 TaxID=403957 RepID=UPI0004D1F601|nr:pyrophosphatase PpaX [Virgibacillus sp. SK37]AIF44132.1 pyrophosphatase [Virgibacillus sp. SK37]
MNIDTILFDLDGTLIDTNELITASFEHTFKKHNLSFTKEEIMGFNGPPLLDTFHNIDPEKADVLVKTYREHNLAEHDRYVKAFPYAVETIQQLKDSGIKVGIVSTKMSKSVHMGLALTELQPLFETIITYDDVNHAKPHPEPVIKAMKALQAKSASTLMVGDNYHDIEAGKNAGVLTAGVAWAHKGRDSLLAYEPTYMLEDMRDLLKIAGV